MALVNGYTLIGEAKKQKTLAGAFNTTNLETTLAILDAIEESNIPSMVQIAPTNIVLSGYKYIVDMVRNRASTMKTPFCLHLDHGKTFEDVRQAVEAGFTSIMIDGSHLPFEENIQLTKKVVDFCGGYNIPVEAELGAITGKEDDEVNEADRKTDPNQVLEFVKRTGCATLAVSVGNVHGFEQQPKIDFDLLGKLSDISPVSLVIHGGSGIDDQTLQKISQYNVVKLNIGGDLRRAYISSIGKQYVANNNEYNLIKVLLKAKGDVQQVVYNKILSMNLLNIHR